MKNFTYLVLILVEEVPPVREPHRVCVVRREDGEVVGTADGRTAGAKELAAVRLEDTVVIVQKYRVMQ